MLDAVLAWLLDLPGVLFIGVLAFVVWWQRGLAREMDLNDRTPAPEDHQVRWHIRHMRQDLALIAYLLMAILGVLVWIALRLRGAA